MTTDLKAVSIRWFEEWWNQRLDGVFDRVATPDCIAVVEGVDEVLRREDLERYRVAWLSAIPDLSVVIPLAVQEGNTVIVQWRMTGTHRGPGLGIPPSGKRVEVTGITEHYFENGLIAKAIDRWNRGEFIASLMQVRMDELRKHAGLTAREAQVALLMGERMTHTEIAADLKIKPNTARRHCEKVLLKLGVNRRQDVSRALGKIPGSVLNRHGSDL